MMWKAFTAVGVFVALLAIAVLTPISFYLWPTFLDKAPVKFSPEAIAQLNSLKAQKKFVEDRSIFYPGAPNEAVRLRGQEAVDRLIDRLIADQRGALDRSAILGAMKSVLAGYTDQDSEERDRILLYMEQILDILKMDGSGELFNVWRYGVPYGWFIK